jgi:chemotaxis protein CheX
MDTLEGQLSADLAVIASDVWEAFMLGQVEVRPCPEAEAGVLTCASVCVSGAWAGVVMVEAGPEAADLLSAALFGMQPGEPAPADITDALGEVVNVIGGNLKSTLPGPSLLSLPVVTTGSSSTTVTHAVRECSVGLHWSGHVVRVVVWRASNQG